MRSKDNLSPQFEFESNLIFKSILSFHFLYLFNVRIIHPLKFEPSFDRHIFMYTVVLINCWKLYQLKLSYPGNVSLNQCMRKGWVKEAKSCKDDIIFSWANLYCKTYKRGVEYVIDSLIQKLRIQYFSWIDNF